MIMQLITLMVALVVIGGGPFGMSLLFTAYYEWCHYKFDSRIARAMQWAAVPFEMIVMIGWAVLVTVLFGRVFHAW